MTEGIQFLFSFWQDLGSWAGSGWQGWLWQRWLLAMVFLTIWVGLAYGLLRFVSLPPRWRVWLWRLFYLKLLLLVLGVPSWRISIPIKTPPASIAAQPKAPTQQGHIQPIIQANASSDTTPAWYTTTIWWLLVLCWLSLSLRTLAQLARAWQYAKLLRRTSVTLKQPDILCMYQTLCDEFGLSETNRPTLCLSENVSTPVLTGLMHPYILLPKDIIQTTKQEQLSLILAHELAHARHGDLWWMMLPLALEWLCFFHPFYWMSRRDWLLQQEMAADQAALQLTNGSRAQYGKILLDFSILTPTEGTYTSIAFGRQRSVQALKERITAMMTYTNETSWKTASGKCKLLFIALFACFGLLPFHIAGTQAAPTPGKKAAQPQQKAKKALVSIMFFHDYQCNYCIKGTKQLAKIKSLYGNKVQLVLKHYPLSFHKKAHVAAQATMAAAAQGKMWAYYQRLNAAPDKLNRTDLLQIGKSLKLDMKAFEHALTQKTYKNAVDADIQLGKSLGVRGIPSFFINGQKVTGVRNIKNMKKLIDAEINKYSGTWKDCSCKGKQNQRCKCKQ